MALSDPTGESGRRTKSAPIEGTPTAQFANRNGSEKHQRIASPVLKFPRSFRQSCLRQIERLP